MGRLMFRGPLLGAADSPISRLLSPHITHSAGDLAVRKVLARYRPSTLNNKLQNQEPNKLLLLPLCPVCEYAIWSLGAEGSDDIQK